MAIAIISESDTECIHDAQPLKRAKKVKTAGAWLLALIVIGSNEITFAPPPNTFCIDTARRLPPRHVCGVLVTRWEFLHTLPESYSWLQRAALKQSKDAQKVHGFLQYPVAHFAKLVEPMAYRSRASCA